MLAWRGIARRVACVVFACIACVVAWGALRGVANVCVNVYCVDVAWCCGVCSCGDVFIRSIALCAFCPAQETKQKFEISLYIYSSFNII